MDQLLKLFATVSNRVKPPVCIALGSPWPTANLVKALNGVDVICYQMDLYQAARTRECLAELEVTAEVIAAADLWDIEAKFESVIFPASAHADRALKLDIIEQSFHVLRPGGMLLSLSEYEKDNQFAKWHKKVFGKCGESPASENGMAFWSTRGEDEKRRRHEVEFHARLGDGPSMRFISRPGTFSYGRFDNGSRAMLEVADIQPGDSVLDLGCGSGAVGCLAAQKTGERGKICFIDSNLRAMSLAKINAEANGVAAAKFVAQTRLEGLERREFDVILANPPYYAKSDITRLFIEGSRDLLQKGGRYHIVTRMPTAVVPMIFEIFGDCSVIENRGYSVILATA